MLAAIAGFFMIGAIGFWALIGCLTVLIFWNIEKEEVGLVTFVLIGATWLVCWANGIPLFSLMAQNLPLTLGIIAGYFVAGTGWAIGKWYFYISRFRYAYDEIKAKWLKKANVVSLDLLSAVQAKDFRSDVLTEFGRLNNRNGYYSRPPDTITFPLAAERKSAILGWMMYWPFSMTWTLINDPVKRAFIAIYRHISGGLDRMTQRITGDIQNELAALDDSKK